MASSMAGEAMAMAIADKAAGDLVPAVREAAIGDLEMATPVTATAGRKALPKEATLATARRMEVIPKIKAGAMTKAPRATVGPKDLVRVMTLERVVARGAAATLVKVVSLERAAQAPLLATIGAPTPTRVPTIGALQEMVIRSPLAMTGALEVTKDLLVVAGDLETTAAKDLLAVIGAPQAMAIRALEDPTRDPLDLLAMVGAQEITRDPESPVRETVAKATLVTARAVDGKSFLGRCLGELVD